MRLDKFLCDCSDLTRSQAGKLIRQGEVMVDGILVKQPAFHINEQSLIEFDGVTLTLNQQNRYFMLHKPEGYVCSNEDPDHATVFHLLDEPAMGKLHVVGAVLEPIPVPAFSLIMGQKSLSGSPTGSRSALDSMLGFAARHGVAPKTEHFPMRRVNDALDHLRAGKARYRIVLGADFDCTRTA